MVRCGGGSWQKLRRRGQAWFVLRLEELAEGKNRRATQLTDTNLNSKDKRERITWKATAIVEISWGTGAIPTASQNNEWERVKGGIGRKRRQNPFLTGSRRGRERHRQEKVKLREGIIAEGGGRLKVKT